MCCGNPGSGTQQRAGGLLAQPVQESYLGTKFLLTFQSPVDYINLDLYSTQKKTTYDFVNQVCCNPLDELLTY